MKKIAVVEKFFEAHHQQQIEAVAGKYGYTVDYYLDGVLPQARAGEYEIVYGMPDRTALKDMTQLKWFCASFAELRRVKKGRWHMPATPLWRRPPGIWARPAGRCSPA